MDDLGPQATVDFTRPPIALASSETAETVWNSLYHCPQIQHFTAFELKGIEHSRWPFLHWDLDGHAGTMRMAALRRVFGEYSSSRSDGQR